MCSTVGAQTFPDCTELQIGQEPDGAVLVVDVLAGQAVFQQSEDSFPLGGITDVCISVFGDESRQAVVTGSSVDGGTFEFTAPDPGEYVLIASHPEFSDVATRIQIRDQPNESGIQQGLLLRFGEQDQDPVGHSSEIKRLALRREILQMYDADQGIRNELIQAGMESPDPVIAARMGVIDAANTSRLLEIITEGGWPDLELVGHDGASAAFTLLQHAEYPVQKQLYALFEAAYKDNKATGQSYAMLTDRILAREGKAQIYGTQARPTEEWIDGEPVFFDIEDRSNVDERRAEVGMPSLAEYAEVMKNLYFPEDD